MTVARQFYDFEAYPKRTVAPDFSIGIVSPNSSVVIDCCYSLIIKHDARGTNPPVSEYWHSLYKSIFSWCFDITAAASHPGAVLVISISNKGSFHQLWRAYPLRTYSSVPFYNSIEGLYIPAYMVRFTLVNSSQSLAVMVNGMIKQQGM